MKFQNPSLNFFLNGWKDERTNERKSRNQYAPHFFKVGGIITSFKISPIDLLIILYQLTKFEAPSCYSF